MPDNDTKMERLKEILAELESVVVAFSGGVDSTFLARVAHDVLGDRAVAFTATSPTYPSREFEESQDLARCMGIQQFIVDSNELEIPNFAENNPRRCYYCKSELFQLARKKAEELGFRHVVDGTNADDENDYRPGRDAACDLGVRSPLLEAGMTKEDIRRHSRALDLPTWEKPNFACLASRFPTWTKITADALDKLNAAENFLRDKGFRMLRVRYHGDVARIELGPEEIERFLDADLRGEVAERFKEIGFTFTALDLSGYRMGSMNIGIDQEKQEKKSA